MALTRYTDSYRGTSSSCINAHHYVQDLAVFFFLNINLSCVTFDHPHTHPHSSGMFCQRGRESFNWTEGGCSHIPPAHNHKQCSLHSPKTDLLFIHLFISIAFISSWQQFQLMILKKRKHLKFAWYHLHDTSLGFLKTKVLSTTKIVHERRETGDHQKTNKMRMWMLDSQKVCIEESECISYNTCLRSAFSK